MPALSTLRYSCYHPTWDIEIAAATVANEIIGMQAVGVLPDQKGGVKLLTKKTKHINRPASNQHEVTWNAHTSGPK